MRLRHSRGGGNPRAAEPLLREAACRDFAPAGDLLFFACPKKRRQKKRHPGRSVALGATSLRCSVFVGGAETRSAPSALRSNICPKSVLDEARSRAHPQSPALLDGSQGPRETLARFAGLDLSTRFASCSPLLTFGLSLSKPACGTGPSTSSGRTEELRRCEASRSASRGWRRGAQGLRGARVSAPQELTSRRLFERSAGTARSEFGAAPQDRAPQSSPAFGRTATVGSPFFGYFLWRSKESNSAAGPRPGAASRSEKPQP
jgi:hypothetical protein